NGSTSPNPSVGAVVTQNQKIIGEGYHQKHGEPHAEVNAINQVGTILDETFLQVAIYVSLEPCFHFGKTPPCVNLILEKKIPSVHIAFTDPNPKVAHQSISLLKNSGVETTVFENETGFSLSKKIQNHFITQGLQATLKPFFTNIRLLRPFIILKWAESEDNFIGKEYETTPLSNLFTKRLSHKWRSECDAIMVGTTTAEVDNPELTNRHYFGKSPVRVVLDRHNRLPQSHNIFNQKAKTFVFVEKKSAPQIQENVETFEIDFSTNIIQVVLKILFEKKVGILFVEGGAKLLNSFIETGLWDEARVFKTPILLQKGVAAPILKNAHLEKKEQLDDNWVHFYRKKNSE
ncbi:MAG: bifunctional diaminohydroxyphosphoribosylaminopyrimidine deaminase/5-amino-6-(5-phosphoribosylamino)uracil reductase RibD, partial [Saprospiraceae bacterium]|nr:bifunctional diaminohydroxyphosphoribosylaminopyrimidine deaminase/5-amino-6-(5-phosphoribosylamino)uracil reductase RibD [Saprospiraceae bacterium]